MRVNLAVQKLGHKAKSFYGDRVNKVQTLVTRISTLVKEKFVRADFRLEKAMTNLDNLSPLKTLKRGYFALTVDDKSVTAVKDLKVGDTIKAKGADGTLTATVTSVTSEEK